MGDDGKSKHPDRVRDRSSVTTAVGAKDTTPFLALQGRVRVVVGELFPMLAVYLAWNSPGWTEGRAEVRAEGRAFPPTDTLTQVRTLRLHSCQEESRQKRLSTAQPAVTTADFFVRLGPSLVLM